jgi:hypothetical protein
LKKAIYIALFVFAAFAGCKDKAGVGDCFMSAGKDGEREVFIGDFYEITAGNRLVINIKQDTAKGPLVVVKGGEHVIKNISVVSVGGELTIDDQNVCNWTRDYSKKIHVDIYCKTLHGLTVTDACEVKTTGTVKTDSMVIYQRSNGKINMDFNAGKLEVNHEGSGEVDLKGYAAVFVPVMFSAGKLDARSLQGDYTFAYHYGINDLHVKPKKVLYAFLGNTGNIYYYAEPTDEPLKTTRVGSGNIEKK